jgi:hypothetical protein
MTDNPHLAQIEDRFWSGSGARHDVWAILDGARDRRIWRTLKDSPMTYSCLFGGTIARELEMAAPHLVHLEYRDPQSRELIQHAWGNSWGVFLKCSATLDTLRRHLQQFLSVRDDSGKLLLFRYYDPRVLRLYLPTCRANELRTVFGPIECFWVEHEQPQTMMEFRFDDIGLVRSEVSVAAPVS